MPLLSRLVLTLPFIFLAGAALAQGASVAFGDGRGDSTLPIEVTADTLAIDQKSGDARYIGNVLVGQGEMRLASEQLHVVYDADASRITRLQATGSVVLVNGTDAAEAAQADYDVIRGVIEMSGDVLLTQGANAISAEHMVVDLDSGTAQLSGRVRTVINPREEGGR